MEFETPGLPAVRQEVRMSSEQAFGCHVQGTKIFVKASLMEGDSPWLTPCMCIHNHK